MTRAFIFGKFLPFHKGHQSMIQFALEKCDFLTVLVCKSDQEKLSGQIRKEWIQKTFANESNLEVRIFNYSEAELQNTSVSSREVSKSWANIFSGLFPEHSVVISSEPYGDFVAEYMGIEHISFDTNKKLTPISATNIRQNLLENWNYLPEIVRSDLALKIVVLGTESTGKSTLCEELSRHYEATLVKEVGRELIEDSNSFQYEDLQLVAEQHAEKIENAKMGDCPIVIIDTDIHITKSYSEFVFGKELDVPPSVYASNKADLYLYLNNDVVYVQDGTRLNETDRNALDASHRQILADHSIDIVEITGNWEERLNKSKRKIDQLIQMESQKNWT